MFLKLHFFFLLGTSRIVLTGLSYGQVGRLLSAGQWSAARIVELHRQVWPPKNPFVTFLSLSANWMQRWQDLRRWKTHVMGKTWVPKWQRRADWALPPTSPWQPRSHTELWHELYRAKPLRLGSFGMAISLPEVVHVPSKYQGATSVSYSLSTRLCNSGVNSQKAKMHPDYNISILIP